MKGKRILTNVLEVTLKKREKKRQKMCITLREEYIRENQGTGMESNGWR